MKTSRMTPTGAALVAAITFLSGCASSEPEGRVQADDLTGEVEENVTVSTTANLNLRAGPSLADEVLDVIPEGTTVTIVDGTPTNGFYKVQFLDTVGFASGQYLSDPSSGPIERKGPPDAIGSQRPAAGRECDSTVGTGFTRGKAFPIKVVRVGEKPVELTAANAYWNMEDAAARDGIKLRVVSGFRTNREQEILYDCYRTKRCNNGNLAARPGYSNHQSGHALDLNTSDRGVYEWLSKHADEFGFERTVPSEKWHWEWWSGGPGGGRCSER